MLRQNRNSCPSMGGDASTICSLRRKYQLLTTCTHSHHWAARSSPRRTTLCHTASYRKTQSSSWCLLHESIIRPSASRIPSAWRPRRSKPRSELSSISSFGFSFFPGLSGADRLRHPFLFPYRENYRPVQPLKNPANV